MVKKLLCLGLTLVMVLSCYGVFAEDEVVIPSYLDAENMTSEATYAITKNLDLSKINEYALLNGNTVTWETSDDAISIKGDTAVVLRDKNDKNVTLTATVNTNPITVKEFDFTVIGTNRTVGFSDTFNYPEFAGLNVSETPVYPTWSRAVTNSECQDMVITNLTDRGTLELKVTDTLPTSSGYLVNFDKKQEVIKFSTDIRSYIEDEEYTSGARVLCFHLFGNDASGKSKKIFEARVSYAQTYFSVMSTIENGVLTSLKNFQVPFGETYNLGFDVDINDGVYSLYVNGVSVTNKPIRFQTPSDENPVVKIKLLEVLALRDGVAFSSEFDQTYFSYPVSKVIFSSPLFKKVEENIETLVNSITEGTYKSELSARNLTDSPKNVALVTAVYSGSGQMLREAQVDEKEIASGESADFTTQIQVNNGEYFKCFLIEGFSSMKPLELPAGKVFNLSAELDYDDDAEEKAHVHLRWDAPLSVGFSPVGYKILRNQLEVGYVDASQTEYRDYGADFFENEFYEVRSVMASGEDPSGTFCTFEPVSEVKLLPTTVNDPITGRTWHYINFFGRNAIRDYYTTRNWHNDKFYFTEEEDTYRMFEYDINTNIVKFLDTRFTYTKSPSRDLMTIGRKTKSLYYVDENMKVARMNLTTYEKEIIADMPENPENPRNAVYNCSFISVNDSETKLVISANFRGANPPRIVPVLDIETGEWDTTFNVPAVSQDGKTGLGMPILNPVKDGLILLNNIINTDESGVIAAPRLWLVKKDENTVAPLYSEKITFTAENAKKRAENGELTYVEGRPFFGENMGHEHWTMDGEKVVVVKYQSPAARFRFGACGITEVSLDGKCRVINEHLGGNHVSTSPESARWIVYEGGGARKIYGDGTERQSSHVSVLDSITGQHYKIADVVCNMGHPGHVHPSFSYDGNYIWFGFETDDTKKTIQIGWADVSDIVATPVVGGREKLTDIADFYTYEDTINCAEKVVVDGEECYKIAPDAQMLIDIDDDLYYGSISPEHTNDKKYNVTLKMKYLDNGDDEFMSRMYFWNDTDSKYSDYYDKTRYEHSGNNTLRKNTNNWIERTVVYKNANLENINLIGTDLRIKNSASGDDLYIKDISITVEELS